ncbi:hypothetical protein Tco_0680508 [Tanacetum coccineum]|uniref:Uncharacterized protein n=1 Tax=Tanacetum coccineum TaxID=301880 RepID=A0ABQ4XKQ0_9ASTR
MAGRLLLEQATRSPEYVPDPWSWGIMYQLLHSGACAILRTLVPDDRMTDPTSSSTTTSFLFHVVKPLRADIPEADTRSEETTTHYSRPGCEVGEESAVLLRDSHDPLGT